MDMTPSPIQKFDPYIMLSSVDELNSSSAKESRATGSRVVNFSFNNNNDHVALRNSNIEDPFDL